MSTTFKTIIYLMPRTTVHPDTRLLKLLGREARDRASGFLNKGRAADFLWSRVLLKTLIDRLRPPVTIKERPPKSPLLISEGDPYFCSVSHTSTFVGVAVSRIPVGIDLEVLDSNRPIDAISERVFGEVLKNTPEETKTLAFYKNWGIHESAVKMPATVSVQGNRVFALNENGREADIQFFHLNENTLLTVMTETASSVTLETIHPESL